MTKHINRFIQVLSYAEARSAIQKVNPALCTEIDALSVDDSYSILKVRYNYGDLLINKGLFHVPDDQGNLVYRNSTACDKTVRDLLDYPSPTPMLMPLNGALELFIDHPERPSPYVMGKPGHIFALTGVLEPESISEPLVYWTMSVGVRSVIMLPKISHNTNHLRLCKTLGIKANLSDSVYDHFHIFKAINKVQEKPWTVDIFVFTKKWFENRESLEWRAFREYLFKILWRGNYFGIVADLCNMFLSEMASKFKPSPDLSSTLSHIVAISQSKKLGYGIATDDSAFPLSTIQKAYIENYKLQDYSPEVMIPDYLEPEHPLFYSLPYPIRVDFSHAQNKSVSKHDELMKLLDILSHIQRSLKEEYAETMQAIYIKNVNYQGIHFKADPNNKIISTTDLAKDYRSKFAGLAFPVNSNFLCGCLKISHE